jgi:putative flippase GtrA
MDFIEFLKWVGTSAGASVVSSFILERIAWFQSLASESKKWIFFGICSVLSVGAYCVLTYVPVEILSAVAPFFGLIASVFVSVFVGEKYHETDKLD